MAKSNEQLKDVLYESILLCCDCGQLLDDPIQLSCFHHCCRACLPQLASKTRQGSVECPFCLDITPISSCTANVFLSRRIRQLKVGPFECSSMITRSICDSCKTGVPAVWVCEPCNRRCCSVCRTEHTKICTGHLNQLPQEVARSFQVEKAGDRTDKCQKEAHSTSNDGKELIAKLLYRLNEAAMEISKCSRLKEDLVETQLQLRKELRKREHLLIRQLFQASNKVEERLYDLYMDVDHKLASTSTIVEQLHRNLNLVSSTAESQANMNDRELDELLQKLTRLTTDIKVLKNLPPVSELITVNSALPRSCKEVILQWYSVPSLSEAEQKRIALRASSLRASLAFDGRHHGDDYLLFAPTVAGLNFRVAQIIDVAVTTDSFLALSGIPSENKGYREFPEEFPICILAEYSLDAKLITEWDPLNSGYPKYARMNAIATLGDGRVAVIVELGVLLLSRNANTIAYEQMVLLPKLDFSPLSIASRDMTFVTHQTNYYGSSHLVMVNLDRRVCARLKLDGRVHRVTLTEKLVVMARSNFSLHVIEAYIFEEGEQLWQWEAGTKESISEVMTDDVAIYATLEVKRNVWRIALLSIETGHFVINVAANEVFLQNKPLKLALVGDKERPLLVFLEERDGFSTPSSIITLHPSRGYVSPKTMHDNYF